MDLLRRHSTGITIAMVVALSIGLSLAPLPDALRPFPSLRSDPVRTVLAAVRPAHQSPSEPLPPPAPEDPSVATGEAPDDPAATPEPEEPGAPPEEKVSLSERDSVALALAALGVPDVAAAHELDRLGVKLGVRHVAIEQGCREPHPSGGCKTPALAPFLRALDGLQSGTRRKPVRILHLGDSQIASDHITDIARERLQIRYGSGGQGFLFIDRPTRFSGRTVRTGRATEGWRIDKLTDPKPPTQRLGFSGVDFSTNGETQSAEFDVGPARVAEIFFLTDPEGGDLELQADGRPLGQILTRFMETEPAFSRTKIPPGTRTVTLVAKNGPVHLHGLSLETGGPGIVYDSIGLPGATAKVLLRAAPAIFNRQVAHRGPALVVLMLGGNEAFEYSRGRTDLTAAREAFTQLLQRVRKASPGSACLLISPMDAGIRTLGGAISPRPGSREIATLLREIAMEQGCGYWDVLSAMGGEGAVARWHAAGLMNDDLIHPLGRGGDLLGHLLDVALARAHLEWRGPRAREDAPGLEDDAGKALERFFSRLRDLERRRDGRVAFAQIGASHTAGQMFTDAVRRRLAERFGDAGRGFVGAGRPSPRLTPSGVQRGVTGTWRVLDALKAPPGEPWGLTGVRVELQADGMLEFSFCQGCQDRNVTSRMQLHYLEEPGMGRLEVLLDGQAVASLPEEPEPQARVTKVLSFEAPGAVHRLEIRNLGPGPASVFGAAAEFARPGVVYDALGLPSSTIWTLSDYEQPSLATQLAARQPDLYVLFFGTNESAIPNLDVEEMRARYGTLFTTLRQAAPDAGCLLLGPTDRQQARPGGGGWMEAPSQARVIRALREVAREHGCAFWSARAAMGGVGAIGRWLERQPPLANADRTHLTPAGYEVLANAFVGDLLQAYEAWRKDALPPGSRAANATKRTATAKEDGR